MHVPDADHASPEDMVTVGLNRETIRTELLVLSEKFFRTASSTVHTELRQFLSAQGYDPITSCGWFLDSLALSTCAPRGRQ